MTTDTVTQKLQLGIRIVLTPLACSIFTSDEKGDYIIYLSYQSIPCLQRQFHNGGAYWNRGTY